MSISKIHLFSKKTDAVEAARGYEYQKLKTLEAWLQNAIEGNDELIYCEYEEDIFHRDDKSQKSKFRQLKLYSSNFSFTTDEIEKALIHFFALYTKGEYLFDDVSFIFEANSNVAREYGNNNAALLKSWFENQEKLETPLLERCAAKVKEIVATYYKAEYVKSENEGTLTKEIQEGYGLFQKLSGDDWAAFVKSIKWRFDRKSPEQAMDIVRDNIKMLILNHPHYAGQDNIAGIRGALALEVANRTVEIRPENRVLSLELLDRLMLEQGTEEDKWYSTVFDKWKDVSDIGRFFIGEFFEVLDAAKYCRRVKSLWKHSDKWIGLLEKYYNREDVPDFFKRKSVYEIVWLKLKPDIEQFKVGGNLIGIDEKLKFFFLDLDQFDTTDALEDGLNIINLLLGSLANNVEGISEKDIRSYAVLFYEKINNEIIKAVDSNRKCNLLEFLSNLRFAQYSLVKGAEIEKIFEPLYEIITYQDRATLYNISQLNRRVNKIIEMLIRAGSERGKEVVAGYEKFANDIELLAIARDGKYKVAKLNIKKGVAYLSSDNKNRNLLALKHFHKAKDLFLSDETMEGYVLAALNIAGIYSTLGCNFAAKYYGLTALWVSINDSKLIQRVPDSFGLLFSLDFKQGAWVSALATFDNYIHAKIEFDSKGLDIEADNNIMQKFSEVGLMIHAINRISPQMSHHLKFKQDSWGIVWEESIKIAVEFLDEEIKSIEKLHTIILGKLDDSPLNDIGRVRTIRWKALEGEWEIRFANSSVLNSLAEEYCSVLQMCICEIALSNSDFQLGKTKVVINIQVGAAFQQPELISRRGTLEYNVTLNQLVVGTDDVKMHNASLVSSVWLILRDLSPLGREEFDSLFHSLFREQGLAQKSYTVNTYQRIYGAFYDETIFKADQRANYQSVDSITGFPKVSNIR